MEVCMTVINRFIPKSIKSHLTLIMVSFSLILSITITSICFVIFQSFLKKNLLQSTEFNLQLISKSFSSELENIINLSEWCTTNLLIRTYIEHAAESDSKPLSLEAYERLKEEFQSAKSTDYINRLIVTNPKGNFLQIANSVSDAKTTDGYVLLEQHFMKEMSTKDSLHIFDIQNDPFNKYAKIQIIPIAMPISSYYSSNYIGWVYLSVNTSIITDALNNYMLPNDSNLYLTIFGRTYLVSEQDLVLIEHPREFTEEVNTDDFHNKNTRSFKINQGEVSKTVVTYPSSLDDIYISQSISDTQLFLQKTVYFSLLLLIFFLVWALGLFLTFYTNHVINVPIKQLRKKLDKISEGDFSRDSSIEWDHELGEIGKGINKISQDVVTLMDKRIADEKQKKDLEYQMLQSQIDPHFLYNTLNSIKWMATIQNATGIAEMTTSLSRLLKNVSKGSAGLVTLREELNLIEDYFLIQNYRYGGTITMEYEISNEELYQCMLPRFTLQPLVENALFHGLEPQGSGSIKISVNHIKQVDSSDAIEILVLDNGVGMSKEQINKVFTGEATSFAKFFKQLGIHNVHKRIQYEFGDTYGIQITSILNQYTCMKIVLPLIVVRTGDFI